MIAKKYETNIKHCHIYIKVLIRFIYLSTSLNNVISFSLHLLNDIFIRDIKHVICELDDMLETSPGCKGVISGVNRSMTF